MRSSAAICLSRRVRRSRACVQQASAADALWRARLLLQAPLPASPSMVSALLRDSTGHGAYRFAQTPAISWSPTSVRPYCTHRAAHPAAMHPTLASPRRFAASPTKPRGDSSHRTHPLWRFAAQMQTKFASSRRRPPSSRSQAIPAGLVDGWAMSGAKLSGPSGAMPRKKTRAQRRGCCARRNCGRARIRCSLGARFAATGQVSPRMSSADSRFSRTRRACPTDPRARMLRARTCAVHERRLPRS
jgi:hypothetical protein